MPDWDVVVIGGGAAGLSAGAEVAGKGRSCLIVDRMGGGGELMNLGPLVGVDGTPAGPDFAAQLLEGALGAGAELEIAEVTGLERAGAGWRVIADGAVHDARAVILASGLAPGKLGVDGEEAFEGRGLSHCAACDGPIYAGQPVIVAGHDRWAIAEAHDLLATTSTVTLITPVAGIAAPEGVTVRVGQVTGLQGTDGLETVTARLSSDGSDLRLPARAIFVQTGRHPALDFMAEAPACDADGRIGVDADLRAGSSSLFAAGDLRSGNARTVADAMADGRRAGAAACAALDKS